MAGGHLYKIDRTTTGHISDLNSRNTLRETAQMKKILFTYKSIESSGTHDLICSSHYGSSILMNKFSYKRPN